MIDTIKIYSMINKSIYHQVKNSSDIKTSYNIQKGQTFYEIVNGHIEGNFNSSLSIKVGSGTKYGFINMYYIEIEGSFHKFVKGYNSHNGFYNVQSIVISLIKIVEQTYKITLPKFNHWFLQRIDIAICYNLQNQENVKSYIDNINQCNFPRRNIKYYEHECIYVVGSSTTLKIYNKLLEFKNNDLKKLKNTNFDLHTHLDTIQGYIRFECEIKKSKLKYLYNNRYIRISNVFYNDLKDIWKADFQKFLKNIENDFKILRNREDVKIRLQDNFSSIRAKHLFDFYILILARGINEVKNDTDRSTYYKNIRDLKNNGIDFSQKLGTSLKNPYINFNPFESQEIY